MADVQRWRHARNADLVRAAACAHTQKTMKLDSKYFDSVRVKQDHEKAVSQEAPVCQWKGCSAAGRTARPRPRARGRVLPALPRARAAVQCLLQLLPGHEQRRHRGLPEGQRHRPPSHVEGRRQRMGARHAPRRGACAAATAARSSDPHGFFSWRSARADEAQQRRTLQARGAKVARIPRFGAGAARDEIKARFKELVKRHHPDANGGDKRSEDKLREIIQAYNYLKQAGLV